MYPANTLQAERLLSLTSTAGQISRVLLILWINKASFVLYIAHAHAVCHAATNLMFRSCMALSSLSPVIENCQW